MMRRLIIAQVLLLAGLSFVFLLPKTPPMREAALKTDLPSFLTGGWEAGPMMSPSQQELEILAKDTEFFRRNYYRPVPVDDQDKAGIPFDPGLMDVLNAGIVLSGKDLSASIHALERCLTAQGYNIEQASTMSVKLDTGHVLPTRRLLCSRVDPRTKRKVRSIAYYWFVGADAVTGNHVKRGVKDFSDRLLRGYDQRWAYITVTAYLDGMRGEEESGSPMRQRPLTETQADGLVREFLAELGPEVIRTGEVKTWYAD